MILLALACAGPAGTGASRGGAGPDGETAADSAVDTGLDPDTAAPPDSADGVPDLGCDARLSKTIGLVVKLAWTAPPGATSYAEFGESPALGQQTPAVADEAVSLLLLGNGPDRDIHWRGVSEVGGERHTCSGVIHTDPAPDNLPQLTVTVDDPAGEDAAGYLFGAWYSGATSQALLAAYRRDGTPVWYWAGEDGGSALDVHGDPDGRGVYYNVFPDGELGSVNASLHLVSRGGEPLESWATPYAHHTFVPLPGGGALLQRTDGRTTPNPLTGEPEYWVGDRLTELGADGSLTDTFSTWDHLPLRENAWMDALSIYPGRDWTHGNLVTWDADAGTELLSLANAQDVLTIDRATGSLLEVVGVDGAYARPAFVRNHDPSWLDADHLLMFMTEAGEAGAVEYARSGNDFVEDWRCAFDTAPYALGQAERLGNGDTFVNYGTRNHVAEVAPDCTVVWAAELESTLGGPIFGQFHLVDDLYSGP